MADGVLERTFGGEFSTEEVSDWIERTLDSNPKLKALGILMSNSVFQKMGSPQDYRNVKIAMEPAFYPDDIVRIVFDPAD